MQNHVKNKKRQKIAFSLILFFIGICLLIAGINRQIEPNIDSVSHLKAKGIVNAIISETIQATFAGIKNDEELFIVKVGEDGAIQMVQANTILINQKISSLSTVLQEKYDHLEPKKINIPIGSVLGSALLSQTKGGIDISVLPLSVSKCDYRTEFEGQGINQTKYKIFVEIESSVRVLQPFSQNNFDITTTMLISEIVILGDVPENYVHVPKEDILDVT